MKKKNQKIGCTVNKCKFNDNEAKECTLDEIMVANEEDYEEAIEKEETVCDSYENDDEEVDDEDDD